MSPTPGPWGCVYDGSSVWSVGEEDDPQGLRIAAVQRRGGLDTWEEAADNGRLIAAAPDLLAALRLILEELRSMQVSLDQEYSVPSDGPSEPSRAETAACAAIAKAEGADTLSGAKL
jgi:hypothetical protein